MCKNLKWKWFTVLFACFSVLGVLLASPAMAQAECDKGMLYHPDTGRCAPVRDARLQVGAASMSVDVPDLAELRAQRGDVYAAEVGSIPPPGGLGRGVLYRAGALRAVEQSELYTKMFVQPSGLAPTNMNLDWLFTTATNRVERGVEVVGIYPLDQVGSLGVYDWSCSSGYPCPGGATSPNWVSVAPFSSFGCNIQSYVDQGDHLQRVMQYVNQSLKRDTGIPPLWQNAVYLWNYCDDGWDLIYLHEYRVVQSDCSVTGCSWWGPILEEFNYSGGPYPQIRELGYEDSSLLHDGIVSELGPAETDYVSDPKIPWELFHITPNRSFGTGNFTIRASELANWDFEDGAGPWQFFSNGNGRYTVTTEKYNGTWGSQVQVIAAGTNVQLFQPYFHLEPNQHYRLYFAAKSSNGADLDVYLHKHNAPYTDYGLNGIRFDLSTEWRAFGVTFTTKNFTTPVDDARLRFWMAPYDVAGMTYNIDYVLLHKMTDGIPPVPPPDTIDPAVPPLGHCDGAVPGNIVANPGFESGKTSWLFYSDTQGVFDILNDSYECSNSAHVTAVRAGTNIQLYQTPLTLQPNTAYRLRFAAKSTTGRKINVFLHKHGSPYTSYGLNGVEIQLTPEWQVFQVQFTTMGFSSPVYDARLRFWLASFAVNNEQYWFDDVALIPVSQVQSAGILSPLDNVQRVPLFEQGEFIDAMDAERVVGGDIGREATSVNSDLSLVSRVVVRLPAAPDDELAGVDRITATYVNQSQSALRDLFFKVKKLTNNDVLLNADGGTGRVGATLTVPAEALGDGLLAPDESFTSEFMIGLHKDKPYSFVVDVYGVNVDGTMDASAIQLNGSEGFVLSGEEAAAVNIFLPVAVPD